MGMDAETTLGKMGIDAETTLGTFFRVPGWDSCTSSPYVPKFRSSNRAILKCNHLRLNFELPRLKRALILAMGLVPLPCSQSTFLFQILAKLKKIN